MTVEGVEKMKCLIGVYKGSRSVQITEVIEDEEVMISKDEKKKEENNSLEAEA